LGSFDALVIGGGPAGSMSAILLAEAGWSVLLLERKRFPRRKVCGEYLSPTNWPLLEAVGVSSRVREAAGPPVHRVGLLWGVTRLSAELPRPASFVWGRALGRERLDTLLLERAIELGVTVRQPSSARSVKGDGNGFACRAESEETGEYLEVRALVVIAAHGSWESGGLPTQEPRPPPRPQDLLGFKAHFREADLQEGLMPLICFPGGYGGMVHCDGGRASMSLCIRRDFLSRLRRSSGHPAGDAVLEHVFEWCPALWPILSAAKREGPWLSAGPIRPGIRPSFSRGIFLVGNAAGEAHPVVAEGISMAMQGAWLLAQRLIPRKREMGSPAARREVGTDYAAAGGGASHAASAPPRWRPGWRCGRRERRRSCPSSGGSLPSSRWGRG